MRRLVAVLVAALAALGVAAGGYAATAKAPGGTYYDAGTYYDDTVGRH